VFTGLITAIGQIESILPAPAGARLTLDADWRHQPRQGESISVSGCCLTVADATPPRRIAFDVVPETLARTTLGARRPGDRVNLERSLRPEDLLAGHLVQGHVDGIGTVERVLAEGEWRLRIAASEAVMEFLTPKGSITVDGVSLTVAACDRAGFEVALIPETLARTTLGALAPGAQVNLETDAVARTILHWAKVWGREVRPGTDS
jgi:riboflavin synthase